LREGAPDHSRLNEKAPPPCGADQTGTSGSPSILDVLRNIEQPFFTPIYDFAAPRLIFGRVALVGDAATIARPHMGFAVAKAGGDALGLSKALSDCGDIDTALARYDAQRRDIGQRIMLHGRNLGAFLGVGLKTAADRAMAKLWADHRGQMDRITVDGRAFNLE